MPMERASPWLLLCSLNNGDMPLTPMTATLWAQKGCDETLNTKCSKRQRQETRSFGNYLIYPGTFLLCSGFPSNQVEQNCLSYVLGRVRPQGQALTSKVRKNILDTWGSKSAVLFLQLSVIQARTSLLCHYHPWQGPSPDLLDLVERIKPQQVRVTDC